MSAPRINRFEFTANHFLLIGGVCALILVFSIIKGDLTWDTFRNLNFSQASSPQGLTYEQALAQAQAELGASTTIASEEDDKKIAEQLAMLDPSFERGAVLGDSTEPSLSMEELMTPENLDKIPVAATIKTDLTTVRDYADSLNLIENYFDTLTLLTAISSRDTELLRKATVAYQQMINELMQLPVPDRLLTFHKVNLLYYSSLLAMSESMSEDASQPETTAAGLLFFSLKEKVDLMRAEIEQAYQVNL
jgi:hypothetical protein